MNDLISLIITHSQKTGFVFLSTANLEGMPHLSISGPLSLIASNIVVTTAWECPKTISNLQDNPLCAIIIWDRQTDIGYQINGKAMEQNQTAALDGYTPLTEKKPIPQVQYAYTIRILSVTNFKKTPHDDDEIIDLLA